MVKLRQSGHSMEAGSALGQAVLDDLAGLWWDPVREEHLELHHQVASLGWALGQGQAFAPQSPDSTWFDNVAAWERHHPVVKCWNVNCAATESLEGGGGEKKAGKMSSVDRLYLEHVS